MRPRLSRVVVFGSIATWLGCTDAPRITTTAFSSSEAAAAATQQTVLHVDNSAAPGGDGSGRAPFLSLGDAVAAANQLGGAMIHVAPGDYPVTSTIKVLAPMTILGSSVMTLDADSLPTGIVAPGTATRIVGTPALDTLPLIQVGLLTGDVVHDVTVANLTIVGSSTAARSMAVYKTQGFVLRGNIVTGVAFTALDVFASSGSIRGNYVTGARCGICLGAGNAASPAVVEVKGNRGVANLNAALIINGTGFTLPEYADQIDATIKGNDFSNNVNATVNVGTGIRLFVIRKDLTNIPNTQSTGHIRATIVGNWLMNNNAGLTVDAGFPYRTLAGVCDPRTFGGTIDVELRDNTVSGNTLTPALVTFTRNTAALASQGALWQYVHGSTLTISDPQANLAGFMYDNPAADPFIGPCPNDATREALDNHLLYNGVEITTGRNY